MNVTFAFFFVHAYAKLLILLSLILLSIFIHKFVLIALRACDALSASTLPYYLLNGTTLLKFFHIVPINSCFKLW